MKLKQDAQVHIFYAFQFIYFPMVSLISFVFPSSSYSTNKYLSLCLRMSTIPFTAATPGRSTTQPEAVQRRGLGGTHFAPSSQESSTSPCASRPLPMYTAALSSLATAPVCPASSPVQPRGIRTIEFSQAAVHGRQFLFPL